MKKIVSLFIALTVVLGANAMPKKQAVSISQPSFKTMKHQLHDATVKRMEMAKNGQRVARPFVKKTNNAGSTITIEANNLQFDYYYGYFPYVYGGTEEYSVEAWFWTDDEVYYGTYTNNDESLEISIYDADDNEIYLTYTTATYQQTANGDQFTAVGTGDDGNSYNINLTFFIPSEPKDTIRHTFLIASGDAYPDYGLYIAMAQDDELECQLAFDGLAPSKSVNNYYTYIATINGSDTTDVGIPFYTDVVIKETATSYDIELNYFANDSNYYVINMSTGKYAPVDTVKHVFTNDIYVVYYGESGDYYIYAHDKQAIVALDLVTDEDLHAGTWTAADDIFDLYYTNAYLINGADTAKINYRNLELVINETKTNYDFTANFFSKDDNKVYSFLATYEKPAAKDSVTYEFPDYTFVDYRNYDGSFDVIAAPADSSIVFGLEFISNNIAGVYTEKNMSGQYSYVLEDDVYYYINKAQLLITGDEDELKVVGQVLANNTLYKLTIGGKQSAIERVEGLNAIQPIKLIRNGQVLIIKDGKYYNLLGTKVD